MSKPKVFMIMPFKDEFFEVFEMLNRQFGTEFDFSHAGDEDNQQNILKDIIQAIYDADIVIADLTGLNPNVFYELGVAHTLNKRVIIITKDLATLPFDLKQYRAKEYNIHFVKFAELLDSLDKYLHGAITGEIVYSNPVRDFLSTKMPEEISAVLKESNTAPVMFSEDGEKGFLDFIEDNEESMNILTENLISMTEDMMIMSSSMGKSTEEINRVNKSGGGTTSFVRKEAKKVAEYISTYSAQLRSYNQKYSQLWNQIEKNTFGLLENQFALQEQNESHLISFLKSLKIMQKAILDSNASVEELKSSSLNNIGIERTLNQSIKFLDEDLSNYLSIMEQIITSIDRIIEKSRFVVGKIDFNEVE